MLLTPPPEFITFISAELLFLIVKSRDIQVIAKKKSQRTSGEQREINRGLLRSILLELFVFVPCSTILVLLIRPLVIPVDFTSRAELHIPLYAALGMMSYGFPFATIRRIVTLVALNTLKEFVTITPPEIEDRLDRPS